MKYLKLFESLYNRISVQDRNIGFKTLVDFSKKDINILKTLIESKGFKFSMDQYMTKQRIRINDSSHTLGTIICKIEDEWFLITMNGTMTKPTKNFKCDSIDGVIDCLNIVGFII
jgi:hypothetical protein